MKTAHCLPYLLILFLSAALLIVPVLASDGSLTRGSSFTVTVTGYPNTPYYIWLTRTSSMSGEPGDQPPVIAGSTAGIEKDPPDGPYTIGSYQYYNGGGQTIREDVAPSTASMSDTNYYAQVTTDSNGVAVVQFKTSIYTATRTYTVKVENPQNPNDGATAIQETLYSRTAPSVMVVTTVTAPLTTHPFTPSPSPPAPVVTSVSATSAPATEVPISTTQTQKSAASPFVTAAGLFAGVLLACRYRSRL
jgi:hypothetical protein